MALYFLGMRALGFVGTLGMTFVALTVLADQPRSDRFAGILVIALFAGAFAVATRVLGRNYVELVENERQVVAVQGGVKHTLDMDNVTFFVPLQPKTPTPAPVYCQPTDGGPVGCGLLTQGVFVHPPRLNRFQARLEKLNITVIGR